MTDQITQQDAEQVESAVSVVAEFVERVAYGGIAFIITDIALVQLVGFAPHDAAEPAILNAALAYYSHSATGRVIRALVAISRSKGRSRLVVTAQQTVKEVPEDAEVRQA